MEDLNILEAVERYISGKMTPDERVYFEQLRKANPEVDQAVVEHTFFLQQMNRFEDIRSFKATLNDTHLHLAEKGQISSPSLKGKAKVMYLIGRYKRTAMIAASIAGITALTISALVWSLTPAKQKSEIDLLGGKIRNLEEKSIIQGHVIENVRKDIHSMERPRVTYTNNGTGFLIDPKGYVVTSAHIVANTKNIAVQANNGSDLAAQIVLVDAARDIAILKIVDPQFKAPSNVPYAIRHSGVEMAEKIFTLGFPRNNIVYAEGYIASLTGFNNDTLTCQISITANPGNSGSPILNKNGEVIGILSAKQNTAEDAVFAIHSKYIFSALEQLQKSDTSYKSVKLPLVSTLKEKEREQQVKKISDYVYMVKVN